MAGLWFEYVWEPSMQMGLDYECSTWIVLSDEAENGDGQYVVYNNMLQHLKEDEEERNQDFIKYGLVWDAPTDAGSKARARFSRHDDDLPDEMADQRKPEQQI